MSPGFEPAHATLVKVLTSLGDEPAVLAEHQRWVRLRPEDAGAHAALAASLLASSPPRLVEALAAATDADYLAMGRNAQVLELRARVHDALGEAVAAAYCRERAKHCPPR